MNILHDFGIIVKKVTATPTEKVKIKSEVIKNFVKVEHT